MSPSATSYLRARIARLGAWLTAALPVAVTIAAAGAAAQGVPPSVAASDAPAYDLLMRPAPATAHGSHKRLIAAARLGSRLLAVGEMGLVIYSDDRGAHWRQAASPASVMLTALATVGATTAFAAGHDGVILRSTDKGATWQRCFDGIAANTQVLASARRQADAAAHAKENKAQIEALREDADDRLADAEAAFKSGPSQPFFGLHFVSPRHGFAVGVFGRLFETTDGGDGWVYVGDRLDNPHGLHLNAITADAAGTLTIASEAGTLFRSTDVGRTWTRIDVGYRGNLYGVVYLAGGRGGVAVAYGFGGHLFASTDSGVTWAAVKSPVNKTFVGAVVLPSGVPVLITDNGQFVTSIDEGRSFGKLAQAVPLARVSGMAAGAEPGSVILVGPMGVVLVALAKTVSTAQ